MKNPSSRTARTPNGVDSEKPIALRLMTEERRVVEQLASQEHRSMASVSRLLLLRGLDALKRDPKHRLVR